RRYVNPGEFVAPGAPLFDLVALDPIEVEFYLPETETQRVRLGVPVEVQVAPFPDETFGAVIHIISPTIDPQTRTLRVKASIDNRDGRLRPGLFARADLGVAERPNVVMVPEDAVLQRADGSVIFVMEGPDRVRRVRVETGIYQDGSVEIRQGVAGNELVVVRGQTDLIHGAKVSLRNRDGSPASTPAVPIGVTQEETSAEASGGAGG
ncbi:MAG: efflux RND transporter periplasmic adaptor subunit, partial [bacterium]|nr:efflux RND transporter periplasmic adaptor subunit [bacterium]